MKQSQVKSRLKRMVAWDQEPTLTDEDLDYLVELSRVRDSYGRYHPDAVEWEPQTSYEIGDVVVTAADELYVCTVSGISGSTPFASGTTVADGSITWTYQGDSAYTPTYDVNKAAYEGWGLKATKASSMISFSADDARFDRDQYIENCLAMQAKYPQLGSMRSSARRIVYPMILEVVKDANN